MDDESDAIVEEKNKFPSESLLTFNKTKTTTIDVIAVDIRNSTELSEILSKNRIRLLTKIYRAYISEVIVAMRSNPNIERVYIEGDGVWAVFKSDKNNTNTHMVFDTAIKVSSIVETINIKLRNKGYPFIEIGIGIETGKSYYAKVGYKGAGINAEVWVGNIVNKAFKLCSYANKDKIKEVVVSNSVQSVLRIEQQKQLKRNKKKEIFHTKSIDKDMKNWLKKNSSTYISCLNINYCYYPVDEKEIKSKFWFNLLLILIGGFGFFYYKNV